MPFPTKGQLPYGDALKGYIDQLINGFYNLVVNDAVDPDSDIGASLDTRYANKTSTEDAFGDLTDLTTGVGRLSEAALSATIATATDVITSPARLAPGLLWAFAGDSHTFGSGTTNNASAFVDQAVSIAGPMVARADSIMAGVAGNTSAQVLARMDTILALNPEAVVVLVGTNDAGGSVSLATTAANIVSIIAKAKAAGCPVVLCTPPPRGAGATTALKLATEAIIQWVRLNAHTLGCELADVAQAVADSTTGTLLTANNADDVHMTNRGHQVAGGVIAKAMQRAAARSGAYGFLTGIVPGLLLGTAGASPDPLQSRATALSGQWYEWTGGSGTAPTYSMVTDTSGFLPAGRWMQMDFNATVGGVRRIALELTTGFSPGDRVALCAHMQVEDVTGTWRDDVAAGNATFEFTAINGGTVVAVPGSFPLGRVGGAETAPGSGIYNIGPVAHPFTIPAGLTNLTIWWSVVVPTGKRVKARLGCAGVRNLTTGQMLPLLPDAPSVVRT